MKRRRSMFRVHEKRLDRYLSEIQVAIRGSNSRTERTDLYAQIRALKVQHLSYMRLLSVLGTGQLRILTSRDISKKKAKRRILTPKRKADYIEERETIQQFADRFNKQLKQNATTK